MTPQARSTLEALIINDPEHPAIRLFVVSLEVALEMDCRDDVKIAAIKHLLGKLERRLTSTW